MQELNIDGANEYSDYSDDFYDTINPEQEEQK